MQGPEISSSRCRGARVWSRIGRWRFLVARVISSARGIPGLEIIFSTLGIIQNIKAPPSSSLTVCWPRLRREVASRGRILAAILAISL